MSSNAYKKQERPRSWSSRLQGERKRLGFTQADFAQIGGVTRSTQVTYENGSRAPDVEYLGRVARHGVDVLYVITATRVGSPAPVDIDGELLGTCMHRVDAAALERGVVFDNAWLAKASAFVYSRAVATADIEARASVVERESRNAVDLLAGTAAEGHSPQLRTGIAGIDGLISEVVRLRVVDLKVFIREARTFDEAVAKLIEQDLGDPRAWPARERGKLLRDLLAERLVAFGPNRKLLVLNEGRCAARLSAEVDELRQRSVFVRQRRA